MDQASFSADELVTALRLHNWYAIVAFALMAFTQLVRKHPVTSPWWQKIPDGWRFVPGVVASFAVGFTTAFLGHETFGAAIVAGFGGVAGIALPAMGLAAGLKESKVPWDGGAGGKAVMLALFMCVTPLAFTTGCRPAASAADVQKAEELAYNAGVVALEIVDQYEVAKLIALKARIPPATQAELDQAQAMVDQITEARAALSTVRDLLQKKSDAQTELRTALALTVKLLTAAKADGLAIPDSVMTAVTEAQKLFGAAQ
jgi:hypothetical protein